MSASGWDGDEIGVDPSGLFPLCSTYDLSSPAVSSALFAMDMTVLALPVRCS